MHYTTCGKYPGNLQRNSRILKCVFKPSIRYAAMQPLSLAWTMNDHVKTPKPRAHKIRAVMGERARDRVCSAANQRETIMSATAAVTNIAPVQPDLTAVKL